MASGINYNHELGIWTSPEDSYQDTTIYCEICGNIVGTTTNEELPIAFCSLECYNDKVTQLLDVYNVN